MPATCGQSLHHLQIRFQPIATADIAPKPLLRVDRQSSKQIHICETSDASIRRKFFLDGSRSYFCKQNNEFLKVQKVFALPGA